MREPEGLSFSFSCGAQSAFADHHWIEKGKNHADASDREEGAAPSMRRGHCPADSHPQNLSAESGRHERARESGSHPRREDAEDHGDADAAVSRLSETNEQ